MCIYAIVLRENKNGGQWEIQNTHYVLKMLTKKKTGR